MEEIIRFCTQECLENPSFLQSLHPSPSKSKDEKQNEENDEKKEGKERVVRTSFVFELKPEIVMELMSAAEYLQIPSLVSHIIKMLAAYAEGIKKKMKTVKQRKENTDA